MVRGVHKNPGVSWHPPADLSRWLEAEAARLGVDKSVILTAALSEYRARHDPGPARSRTEDNRGEENDR